MFAYSSVDRNCIVTYKRVIDLKHVYVIVPCVFFSMVSSRGCDAQQTPVCAGEKAAVQW